MREIPASLQTTYANLLQAHLNQPAFEFEGAPFKLERRGKKYWYANQRGVGAASPQQRYLGPDTEEMRARIDAMRSRIEDREAFREASSRMVAQLRAGGIPAMDRQTGTALRALHKSGVFRLGGTLVGTHAFRHYDLELGVILTGDDAEDAKLRETEDLDIASFERLSAVIDDEADPDLGASLTELGFVPANTLRKKQPTTWRHTRSTYAIDFLTPSFEDDEAPRRLAALNIWAQGLHYLDFLIKDPMPAVSLYMEGLLVQVPRPERYAVHKLIIAQKRRAGSGAKTRKDAQQARALIWAMAEDRPQLLRDAIAEADARGEQWRKALDQALEVKFTSTAFKQGDNPAAIWFEGSWLGATIRFDVGLMPFVNLTDAGYDGSEQDFSVAIQKARKTLETQASSRFRKDPAPQITLTADGVAAAMRV